MGKNSFLFLIITLFALFGCDSILEADRQYQYNGVTLSASELSAHIETVRENRVLRKSEESFHKIARDVPGFGGFYFDEEGRAVMYLTDDAPKDVAKSYLVSEFRSKELSEIDKESIIVRKGQYSFEELALWRELVSAFILTNDEFNFVLSSDLDEYANRVTIGIDEETFNENNISLIRNFLSDELKIPLKAIQFTRSTRPELLSSTESLTSPVRPLIGGLGINKGISDGGCTMGFVANLDGYAVFVTNSHCTNSTFDPDNSSFFQGFTDPENLVGSEYRDPNTTGCGAWPWQWPYKCRKSDAAAIKISTGVSYDRGLIARTTFKNNSGGSGSKIIDDLNPTFSIAKSDDYIAEGTTVSKIGKTTGWTEGKIEKTCVDKAYPGPEWWILKCQYRTDLYADGGDSGSPVFRQIYSADGSEYISLYGIVYLKDSKGVYFSPMNGIRSDLGSLYTNDPNSDYTAPPPYNGGGGPVTDDPCEIDPLNCHEQ